jgi:hypothetical protein
MMVSGSDRGFEQPVDYAPWHARASDGATQAATALSAADARRRRPHARGAVGRAAHRPLCRYAAAE